MHVLLFVTLTYVLTTFARIKRALLLHSYELYIALTMVTVKYKNVYNTHAFDN